MEEVVRYIMNMMKDMVGVVKYIVGDRESYDGGGEINSGR